MSDDTTLRDLLASAAASLTAAANHLAQQGNPQQGEAVTGPLDRVLAWVATHPDPLDRAVLLGALVDRRNAPALATARADAIRAAVQASSRDDVAARLGLTPKTLANVASLHATKEAP